METLTDFWNAFSAGLQGVLFLIPFCILATIVYKIYRRYKNVR